MRVGESLTDYTQWDKIVAERDALRKEVSATIERCAQRLDAVARRTTMDVAKTAFEEAAAIVRAMKNEP